MKKVKLIMSAFAVVTVVGSALAFKASSFQPGTVFCLASGTVAGTCPIANQSTFVEDQSGPSTTPCGTGSNVAHVFNGTDCVNSTFTRFRNIQ